MINYAKPMINYAFLILNYITHVDLEPILNKLYVYLQLLLFVLNAS